MTPERLQQIEGIFLAALEHAPEARAAFLNVACASDLSLRAEVESLLAADADAASFMEGPALQAAAAIAASQHGLQIGQRIGPYRILSEIGRGGMGAVYLAERDDRQYEKQVAIKLVKRGMDTDFIIDRFRHERQILANLDHPNIARLLDGGTTDDGLPYLVMEYAEGVPINVYCDQHRLSIAERLHLFKTICSAVHYAHQNMVVHRDIKPGNLLVTVEGTPKLLDFGIAKLLDPDRPIQGAAPTATVARLMTPDYASPEQVRGLPVTTASDVYSLGVLLYELLTGHRPYHIKSRLAHEIAQVVCKQEPEKPSAVIHRVEEKHGGQGATRLTPESVSRVRDRQSERLRRRLQGDLDNIVLKAMRKEPERRYVSVEQLAEDLRRHLEGLPVIARKDTVPYRAGKFIRRHKVGVSATLLVVLALLSGMVISLWQARVAQRERARAERRFNEVRKLANSFLFEFHDSIKNLVGSTPAQQLIVSKALEYLDSLAQEAGDDLSLMRELGNAYHKVAAIEGSRTNSTSLGNSQVAMMGYRRAIAIREAIIAADPSDTQTRADLATSYQALAHLLLDGGDSAAAVDTFQKTIAIVQALADSDPANLQARLNLMITYRSFYFFASQHSREMADEVLRKALDLNEELAAAAPENTPFKPQLAVTLYIFGTAMWVAGEFEKSRESFHRSETIIRQWRAQEPTSLSAHRNLIACYTNASDMLCAAGQADEEFATAKKMLDLAGDLVEKDPKNAQAGNLLALAFERMGRSLKNKGDFAGALAYYHKNIDSLEQLAADDAISTRYSRDLAEAYLNAAEMLFKVSSEKPAMGYADRARQRVEQLIEKDPHQVEIQRLTGRIFHLWARLLARNGRAQEAREYTARAFALKKALADKPDCPGHIIDEYTQALLTCEPEDMRDPATALRYARRAAELTKAANPRLLLSLAQAYRLTGDPARAAETAKQALALLPPRAQNDSLLRRELEAALAGYSAALNGRKQ